MKQYNIKGMSCAACSARVEKAVSKVSGVTSCSVNLLTNSMSVEGSAADSDIIKAVKNAGYGASSIKNKEKAEDTSTGTCSMKKNIRIIVADDNSLVREMLVDGIADQKDFEILATASNGRETIELIKEHEPDVVLLDLVMPIVDGLGVMEAVREDNNGKVPYFIIVSAAGKEDIVTQALDSGASYFFMKPFDEGALIRRIRQLCDSEPKKSIAESSYMQNDTSYSVENETSSLIRKLGMPAKMIGYKYAIDAIMITLEEPDAIVSITKDIYPKIGERYGTSPTNVERNIRYGIETAWSKRDSVMKTREGKEIFGSCTKRPTNSEFINSCSEWLKFHKSRR